ncbi:hypothetical protein JWG43_14730 [Desulfobulbus alkaliphilus]|nr:hypothetical protein [Desulfobulbus alkaliphilus]
MMISSIYNGSGNGQQHCRGHHEETLLRRLPGAGWIKGKNDSREGRGKSGATCLLRGFTAAW